MTGAVALYRAFNEEGDLLYVGISSNPKQRWIEHACSKQWWRSEVHRKTVEWFPTRLAAARAEALAVRSELPTRNLALPAEDGSSSYQLIARWEPQVRSPRRPRRSPDEPSGVRQFSLPKASDCAFSDAVDRSPDPEADMSKVIRQLIRWYVSEPGAVLPERPAPKDA